MQKKTKKKYIYMYVNRSKTNKIERYEKFNELKIVPGN